MEFEKIFKSSMEKMQNAEITPKKIAAYASDDRKKMLDNLRIFFINEDRDDFVTLFGIYCNFYIKGNYHQVLSEKDFGISELWDSITDENFQKYLLLIQEGIYNQTEENFKQALKIFKEYSLPRLYIFIYAAKNFDLAKTECEKNSAAKIMQNNYDKMNPGLREYVLGEGKFKRKILNPALDENFLPYVKALDFFQDFVFNLTSGIMSYYSTYKNFQEAYAFDKVVNKFKGIYEIFQKNAREDFEKFPALKSLFDNFFNTIFPPQPQLTEQQQQQFLMAHNVITKKLDYLERCFLSDSDQIQTELESAIRLNVSVEWRDNSAVAYRLAFLEIPLRISNAGSFLLDQMEKWRLQKEKDKIQKKKDEFVSDFTHRYKNLQATRLGEIAESLLKIENEEEKKWGRMLLLELARKETLTKEASMLYMRYNEQVVELVESLKKSLKDDGDSIKDILETAALNCFTEFFYDDEGKDVEKMKYQAKRIWDNLDDKRVSFEKEVLSANKKCIEWMLANGLHFQIDVDERWQKIFLRSNDYAEIFLRSIFLEMLKNFLKHGEIEKPVELKLYSDENILRILMRNSIDSEKDVTKKDSHGLSSMNLTLKTLYRGQNLEAPKKCVRYSQGDDFFITELEMPAEIFLKKEDVR